MPLRDSKSLEKLVSLCKRRGYVYPSSEIYGGLNGCYDFGPLGVELLRNIKDEWWQSMTSRTDVEGIDASILMHRRVWEASGHVEHFTDPMVDCRKCKGRFREDEISPDTPEKCPRCGTTGELTPARAFNLMFKTHVGSVEDGSAEVFLRPETAQGIYVNYMNVLNSTRQKVPFGIAQIGKAFRNEINPRHFLYRIREFEQMEMQFFVKPGTDEEWFDRWRDIRLAWYQSYGIPRNRITVREVPDGERAHYAKRANDFEYDFPFGTNELEGIHNRSDYDLGKHQEYSSKNLRYSDQQTGERYLPYIIETSAGATRSFLAFLCEAYAEDEIEGRPRTLLSLHPRLAPIKVGIFPLVKKDGMPEKAEALFESVRRRYKAFLDVDGAIGRRYRRQDEAGTPFCMTIDSQTLEDGSVTMRNRDTLVQERVNSDQILHYLADKLSASSA